MSARITPIDIQQQQFKSRPFGYEKAGVDQFLEMLAEELERLGRQNQDLKEELVRTKEALAEMKEREATLKETLLTTQKVTDELKATARREVKVMMADAELRAERLMRSAEERRVQLISEIQEIKRQKIAFESSLRSLLEKHVRMLELSAVELEERTEETRLLEEPLPFEEATEGSGVEKTVTVSGSDFAEPATAGPEEEPVDEFVIEPASARPASETLDLDDTEFDIPFDFNTNHIDTGEDPLK